MNTIQKIMNILMNPNAELTNIISIPCTLIEIALDVNICLVLLNIKSTRKSKYICIILIYLVSIIGKLFLSTPFTVIFNILVFILIFLLKFKTRLIATCISISIPFILTALFEMISSQIYATIFNKPYAEAASMPLYHLIFLIIVYSCMFVFFALLKKFKLNITTFAQLNKKDTRIIFSTTILGFVTIFLQLYITAFYNNILPSYIILLSIICLIAYFFVSIFNIIKTKQLEIANRDIENLQLYNNTLKIMYDNIRAFKHDFHNIMNGIGRICNSKRYGRIN